MTQISDSGFANGATTTTGGQDAHRSSLGKDILHRMGQLEEKTRLSNASLRSKALPLIPASNGSHRQTHRVVPAPKELPSSSSSALARSSTAPSFIVDKATSRRGSNFSESTLRDSNPRDSVPRSPTWSIKSFSKRKRSRSKESTKSIEKDINAGSSSDSIAQATNKPRKRLSKKPPSAFTTQGYSFAETDFSNASAPSEAHTHRKSFSGSVSARGRSSSEASRSSTLPFPDLLRRKGASRSSTLNGKTEFPTLYGTIRTPLDAANDGSQQSIETTPVAKPIHKAHESKSSTSTKLSSSDEVHRRDVVNFALEMEKSSQKALELARTGKKSSPKRGSSVPLPQSVAQQEHRSEIQRNPTAPALVGAKASLDSSRHSKQSSTLRSSAGKLDNGVGGYRYPSFKKLLRKQKTRAIEDLSSALAPEAPEALPTQPKLERASSNETSSPTSSSGSHGYVEKQRLYMQRRSIAGYEEEVALMEATNAMRNALHQYGQDQSKNATGPDDGISFAEQPKDGAKENNLDRHDSSRSQSLLGSRTLTKLSFRKARANPALATSSNNKHLEDCSNEPKEHQQPKRRSPLPRALTITAPTHDSHDDSKTEVQRLDKTKAAVEADEKPNREQAEPEKKQDIPTQKNATSRSLTLPIRPKHQSLMDMNVKSTATLLPSQSLRALDSPRHTLLPLRSHPPDSKDLQAPQQKRLSASPEPIEKEREQNPASAEIETKQSPLSTTTTANDDEKSTSKLFVICCKCQRWHDLPNQIYQILAGPLPVVSGGLVNGEMTKHNGSAESSPEAEVKGLEGKIYAAVKCPWCEHGMTKSCCQRWTGIVQLRERHS